MKMLNFVEMQIYMKRILFIFYLFVILVVAISCSEDTTQSRLDDIATIVCTFPDSAKKELESMDESDLTTEWHRAYHALLECESEYFSKCTFDDSTYAIAAEYFRQEKNSTTSQRMEFELLDIYKKIYTNPAESMYRLLEMEKHIDAFSNPHFKAMLESFILIIYYNNREYEKMLKHAYKELKYAEEGKIISRIVNSKFHVGIAYKNMGKLDSAYVNYCCYKKYEQDLDSTMLFLAYHNIAALLRNIKSPDDNEIILALQNSLKYNTAKDDSAKTYMLIADYYYNINKKEKADSFLSIFYNSIRNDDYCSFYNISWTLSNYYEKIGNMDSANKYKGEILKYRVKLDSVIRAGRTVEITHQSEMEDIEEDSLTKLEAIGVVSVVLIGGLLCYIVVYRRKRNKLKKEYETCIENLDKALVELDVIRNKEKESRKIISSELHKHRSEVKKLTEIADMYSVKLLVMLTKKKYTDFGSTAFISKYLYDSINNVYGKSDKGRDFVEKITEACPGIKARELLLCILYREGVSDDRAILDILNVTADTFRSLKSRLRKKLKDAPENQYIAEVLDVMGR